MSDALWQLGGWTMLHCLWVGSLVALIGGAVRAACRRAPAGARYGASLLTLCVLAATPAMIAGWLVQSGELQPRALPGGNATQPNVVIADIALTPRGRESFATGKVVDSGETLVAKNSRPLPANVASNGLVDTAGDAAPGQSPGLQPATAAPVVIDLKYQAPPAVSAPALDHPPRYSGEGSSVQGSTSVPEISLGDGNPSPNRFSSATALRSVATGDRARLGRSLQGRGMGDLIAALEVSAGYLPWIWLLGAPVMFTLLSAGLIGSRRLHRGCVPMTSSAAFDACERLRRAMRISRHVAVAACDAVAQPVLVGIVRPLIILPAAAINGWTAEELEMVLVHELSHVRRWDNLVNLVQRLVEAALFFHPAVWLASRRVRRDREECCDAAVIAHTARPEQYATLLVGIAAKMHARRRVPLALASAMADHPLAGRIRRILKLKDEPMKVSHRTLAGVVAAPLLIIYGLLYTGAVGAQDPPPSKGTARGGIESVKDRPTDTTQKTEAAQAPGSDKSNNSSRDAQRSADIQKLRKLFIPSETNPVTAEKYPENQFSVLVQQIAAALNGLQTEPTGGPLIFEVNLSGAGDIQITAPRSAHEYYGPMFKFAPKSGGVEAPAWSTNVRTDNGVTTYDISGPVDPTATFRFADLLLAQGQRYASPVQPHGEGYVYRMRPIPGLMAASRVVANGAGGDDAPARFPSLEDQKIADRAYKLLGLELEPAKAADLEPAKKLGYNGGLRITGVSENEMGDRRWFSDYVLVGLHVWPVTDFESLSEILNRDDLAELSPLKYYLAPAANPRGQRGIPREIVTGRIEVDLDAWRGMRRPTASHQWNPGAPPTTTTAQPVLPSYTPGSPYPALPPMTYGPPPLIAPSATASPLAGSNAPATAWPAATAAVPANAPTANASKSDLTIEYKLDGGRPAPFVNGRFVNQTKIAEIAKKLGRPMEDIRVTLAADKDVSFTDLSSMMTMLQAIGLRRISVVVRPEEVQRGRDAPAKAESYPTPTPAAPIWNSEPAPAAVRPQAEQSILPESQWKTTRATAYLKVKFPTPPRPLTPQEIEKRSMNVLGVAKSRRVIDAAVNRRGVRHLMPDDEKRAALAKRIAEQLHVSFPGDGEVMELRLEGGFGNRGYSEEWLDAVVDEFRDAMAKADDEADRPKITVLQKAVAVGLLPANPEAASARSPAPPSLSSEPPLTARYEAPTPQQPAQQSAQAQTYNLAPGGPSITIPAPTAEYPIPRATISAGPVFVYDGGNFAHWSGMWRSELKTEKRIEAINALAAFGRAGMAKEAAEAILEVARQYDFTHVDDKRPEGMLKMAVIEALTHGDRPAIPADVWLPMLVERARQANDAEQQRWHSMLKTILWRVESPGRAVRPLLIELAQSAELDVANEAISDLLSGEQPLDDPAVASFIRAELQGDRRHLFVLELLAFRYLDQAPEQLALLFHADAKVQQAARRVLSRARRSEPRSNLTEPLLAVLDDPARSADHVAAIRALVALQGYFAKEDRQEEYQRVLARLQQVLREGEHELINSAFYAIARLMNRVDKNGFVDQAGALEEIVSLALADQNASAERTEKIRAAPRAIQKEHRAVLPAGSDGGGF